MMIINFVERMDIWSMLGEKYYKSEKSMNFWRFLSKYIKRRRKK